MHNGLRFSKNKMYNSCTAASHFLTSQHLFLFSLMFSPFEEGRLQIPLPEPPLLHLSSPNSWVISVTWFETFQTQPHLLLCFPKPSEPPYLKKLLKLKVNHLASLLFFGWHSFLFLLSHKFLKFTCSFLCHQNALHWQSQVLAYAFSVTWTIKNILLISYSHEHPSCNSVYLHILTFMKMHVHGFYLFVSFPVPLAKPLLPLI